MHCEQVVFGINNIEALLQNLANIIPVGTTSMRALESLYWLGVDLLQRGSWNRLNDDSHHFFVEKLFAYQQEPSLLPSPQQVLEAILAQMKTDGLQEIVGETEIFIFPGYVFKICKGIITNFHQPDSTLILLVAALLGNDWQKVYQTALANNYRFLSYGDSSLLLP
jgi:S-adenosylmethionine:tRNA ribosyltransferase-isomerase